MAKYDPLKNWLLARVGQTEVTAAFADIEELIQDSLPASAHQHAAWWANDPSHVHALAWLDAGWRADAVDQAGKRVRFRRSE